MTIMNRVRTVWAGVAGAPYYSNLYFTDDATLGTAQDASDAVDAMWTSIAGSLSTAISWTVESIVARIDDATGTLVGQWGTVANTGAGTTAGDLIPRQAQALYRWNTAAVVNGRLLKGRTFVPGFLEAGNDAAGNPTAAIVTGLTTTGNALIADPGNELRVWSRTHGTSAVVTSCQGASFWATLRSRRT